MKPLWLAGGLLFFGLAALGVALPVLPTTPFLLLSSFCFAKGSVRFHRWLKSTRIYRNNLEGFERERAMTLRAKLTILVPATLMLAGAALAMQNAYGRSAIGVLLLVKYYYFFFRIRTLPADAVASGSPSANDLGGQHHGARLAAEGFEDQEAAPDEPRAGRS